MAENFIEYILLLDINETDEIENDIKFNGWGLASLKGYEKSFELLRSFDIFSLCKWKTSMEDFHTWMDIQMAKKQASFLVIKYLSNACMNYLAGRNRTD